jgi:hypothetical protein
VSLVARYREPSMLELREGECQDLSLNGMFIHTAKPSPRGALIRFECDAGRQEDNFRGTGRVVWQRRKPDSRGPAGMGVRFVRLESGDHDALERIIRQLNDSAPANPGSASQRAHLGATIRGMPGQADPGSDHPVPSPSARPPGPAPRAEGGDVPMRTSARPPMPTLLEVPRSMPSERQQPGLMATVPETASTPPGDGPMDRTLLGRPAPSMRPRTEGGRAGEPADGTRAAGGGSATVIESAVRPEQIASARAAAAREQGGEPEAGRSGGRAGSKKRTRPDRPQRDNDGSRNGKGESGPTAQDARGQAHGGSARSRGRTDASSLELSEPMGADVGARRRRLAYDDDGDGRPESEPPRKNPGTVMWLVLGTGLIVSWGLVTLFGTVPIGVPDKYEVAASKPVPGPGEPTTPPAHAGAAPANTTGSPEPGVAAVPPTRRYALFVDTHPAGARITVAGQSVVAPARVEFDTIQPPLKLVAELASYKTTTVDVWPSDFTANGARLEHRLVLDLQPESAPADDPAAVPAREPARAPGRAAAATAIRPRRPEPTPPAPTEKPAPGATSGDAPSAAEPAPAAAEPQAPSPAPSASGSAQGGAALAQALDCLGRGDNRCVIRALENRANSARELELLIETYRAMSSTPKAESEMRRYLSIYPNGKRAPEYRRLLERRGANL